MALDYLSIPGTYSPIQRLCALLTHSSPASSVDVERAFSKGGIFVSNRRHSLSERSIRAGLLVASWTSVPKLIDDSEMVAFFKKKMEGGDKGKGKGKGKGKKGKTGRVSGMELDVIEIE